MKNPTLYEPKQRQGSGNREALNDTQKIFEIKDLDVNSGLIQAQAMLRKESSLRNGRQEIPISAKQVELVKHAVSKSPEMLSPMTTKEGKV